MTLTEQAKALNGLLHSDFCESDESIQLEAIYCELENAYNMGFKAGQLLITDNWIPVSERLPELYETILACNKEEIKVCRYTTFHPASVGYKRGERGKWFEYIDHDSVFSFNNVTHWQPLPSPPTDSATGEYE